MNEENNLNTEDIQPEVSNLHKVTPLSKYMAMALFVLLPFVGGYVGYMYAPEKVVEVEKVVFLKEKEPEIIPEAEMVKDNTGEQFGLTFKDLYKDINLIQAAPTECLPTGWDVSLEAIEEMKLLEFGKKYGSFTYVGYECRKYNHAASEKDVTQPDLYFEGVIELSGNYTMEDMAGVEHYVLTAFSEKEILKVMRLADDYKEVSTLWFSRADPGGKEVSSLLISDIDTPYPHTKPTSTIMVDGLILTQQGGGYQNYYPKIVPNVREVTLQSEDDEVN